MDESGAPASESTLEMMVIVRRTESLHRASLMKRDERFPDETEAYLLGTTGTRNDTSSEDE